VAAKYHECVKSSNPPHIYAIADQAYFSMRRTGKAQCAVISGESGAGKTESAKHMIKQIIRLCHTGPEGAQLERKIIQVNPVLEAFGNAKTLMNDNSSRFGKYTELKFDGRGGVMGAVISEYVGLLAVGCTVILIFAMKLMFIFMMSTTHCNCG
jgi:myosin heavy subunit